MNLKQWFADAKLGAKKDFADKLGITPTWLCLLIGKKKKPSALLARKIEKATKGAVPAKELRPDLFN